MAVKRKSARQRLINTAFQLFSSQGVAATTTRQVADLAGVNEVTLFRQFGSKHGLLSAVMEEAEVLSRLDSCFDRETVKQLTPDQALRNYFVQSLDTLDQLAELVCSVVGEAGQFSTANQQAVGRGLQSVKGFTNDYFSLILADSEPSSPLATDQVASLVTALLVSYAVIDGTTPYHDLWPSRETLIEWLVRWLLCLRSRPPTDPYLSLAPATPMVSTTADLPAPVVHRILQVARKAGVQSYAIVYVLFGAGLTPEEIAQLQRVNAVYDQRQHILQVGHQQRQVPVNQWIMGHRYGTYPKNPLTRWLKSRNDDAAAMFIGSAGQPMTAPLVRQLWADLTTDVVAPTGQPAAIEQARATWCIEMLLKGLTPQGLSLLTGLAEDQLIPLVQKAQERAALEEALRLDRQPD
ncbi:MAG: TetR/AcrR family transcriptional regulator [Leptolyngbya sp. LCM1.Bin17]|nr:MAG: TetR/AcrR family transcriptional regulator [Leptolyngbya sp. LCM1.Bin17]